MRYSKEDITTLRSLNIIDVATKLGIKVYRRGATHSCHCFLHSDNNPSMSLVEKTGKHYWHCFACNRGGDTVSLVRLHSGLSFIESCDWLCREFGIKPMGFEYGGPRRIDDEPIEAPFSRRPTPVSQSADSCAEASGSILGDYLRRSRSMSSMFCKSILSLGILSFQQMHRAAERYLLGATRDEAVIFWQVDRRQQVLDGKIMYYLPDAHRNRSNEYHPRWTATILQKTNRLPSAYAPVRCLFGEHLLEEEGRSPKPVAVVESEKTAVICSELFPEFLWMASGGFSCLNAERFVPLKGHRVVVFPDTDPDGKTFAAWRAIVAEAQKLLSQPIYISDVLECNASAEQKARKIDIADYVSES